MVDVTEFIESNFIGAKPEWDNKIVVFVTEPVWKESNKFGTVKKQLVGAAQHDGKTYQLAVGKTNAKVLAKAFGPQTTSWIGKKIKLCLATVIVQGEAKKTLAFEPLPIITIA